MSTWVGQLLNDRFLVEQSLGQGGMAAVYLASDQRLEGRRVVVKHPLREADRLSSGLSDDELRKRFRSEVSRLIQLDDIPHVVPILDQGVHEGTPFYVMRHMAGGSLADLLRAGPQAPGEALAWLVPVAEALDRLHRRGLLHRDVKPENLLFDRPPTGGSGEPPRAHLSDFGIVKELQAEWATTGVNTGIGTPGYMAPEQFAPDAEPDGRADQYALAATLYHALTGSKPRYETTGGRPVRAAPAPGDVEARSGRKRLTPVSRLAGHVPEACSAVIERALAREPDERYATCGAFVAAFEVALSAADDTPAAAGSATAVPTRQGATPRQEASERPSVAPARPGGGRRWLLPLLALAALGGIGYAVLQGLQGPGASPATSPSPAPRPAAPSFAPAPAADTQAPEVRVGEPSGDVTTTAAKVTLTGTVNERGGSLSAVVLKDGAVAVPLEASGTFTYEVALSVDEEREVKLVAVDGAGNASAAVVRRLKREALWAGPLREAEAARLKEDGEVVKAALAKAKAADVPFAKVEALSEYVRQWDAEPVVQVTGASPVGEASPGGLPRSMRVAGTFQSGRVGDRLLVDGREAAGKPGAFTATVTRSTPGTVEVPYEVRAASGAVRKQGTLSVTFETPPPKPVPPPAPPPPTQSPVPAWAKVSSAQNAEAQRLGVPVAYEESSTGLRFVLIPGGSFEMGSAESDSSGYGDERPQHRVTVNPYYLSVTEVTNAQYKRFKADHDGSFDGPTQPAENVSHGEAEAFAAWLNGQGAPKGYRLPTEAEWEYAARAGTSTRWSFGEDESRLGEYAWFSGNTRGQTHPVGEKKANPWGLFDMYGNVFEWCADDEHDDYKGAPTDGSAWIDSPRAAYRVSRGGGWLSGARALRSAIRLRGTPSHRDAFVGFRLARPVTAK